ncbi:MAG: TetM/TetW/TetO/TetS family tetracycline resistance ribosomal protection protein [Erysipelotrichaceae bacterium]|nr:TetM/TetW/TetO/TetS family tetracycline resistance ribosomal protection protein [Erysipelotrichaceae bacterium]
MKKIVIGILAHVDAGKTTLSESLLYLTGQIRHLGRVDHQDTFLDYNKQERDRGITIFSKQVNFQYKDTEFILVDTPGHVDFSSEMERTLQILDYAIVVISGLDGMQSHSETIFRLLEHYHVPVFIFVNKMDLTPLSKDELFKNLVNKIGEQCIIFDQDDTYENIALCDDCLLDDYLSSGTIDNQSIAKLIHDRRLFPIYFGSALKNDGVQELLDGFNDYTLQPQYNDTFSAQVFKISHEGQVRLTHLKILGGRIKPKETINDEKIDEIRVYSGLKYQLVNVAVAGDVVVLKGPTNLEAGQSIGISQNTMQPVLSPYMTYRIVLDKNSDTNKMLQSLSLLAKEDPQLHLSIDNGDIYVQLMGEVQTEILKTMVKERFHEDISFDQGRILYKETITEPVEGVGHFEPLRHYAEVHVLLEPLPLGSGIQVESKCKEDDLPRHFQRLILTHIQEIEHIGVLTGSPITDIKISLLIGKYHPKHTEGGDFREATYRAIRQGLKIGKSILLEPYYHYQLELEDNYISRALYDIDMMHGTSEVSSIHNGISLIEGEAPISQMQNYQQIVISYTKGKGKLQCHMSGYRPCVNANEVIATIGYDSEKDVNHPTGSIFCAHGAGYYVPYDEVKDHMHIPFQVIKKDAIKQTASYHFNSSDEELDAIFEKTYGPIKHSLASDYYRPKDESTIKTQEIKPQCMLIDGYNIIFGWDELSQLAKVDLGAARDRLIDILSNYQGYKQCMMIIVFDAYKVKDNPGSMQQFHNMYIVYTKEAQTADAYIERATHTLSKDYRIIVATSDNAEQVIVLGHGAMRMSARELELEVKMINENHLTEFMRNQPKDHDFVLEEDMKKWKKEE